MSETLTRTLFRLVLPAFLCVFLAFTADAQKGYIYVHVRALNEESSVNFPFTISGGVTSVPNFTLNDQPDVASNVADIGVSHGTITAGDGDLWAAMGNGAVYHRLAGSSQWISITVTGSVNAIDGAAAGQCVYVNTNGDAYWYNGTTSLRVYAAASHSSVKATDISYGGGRLAITCSNGSILTNKSTDPDFTDSWNTVLPSNSNAAALDVLPSSGKIAYYNNSDGNIYTITFTGTSSTNMGKPGGKDVCFDDNGKLYSNGYNWVSGTNWTADASMGLGFNRCTAGTAGQVWCNSTTGNTAQSIYTRVPSNGLWIDDERVRTTYNDNSIMIPVSPGTYTLSIPNISSWYLGDIELYDPSSNSTADVAGKKVTLAVEADEAVHVVVHEDKLLSLSVAKSCVLSAVEDFGTGASAPSNVTSYHYINLMRLEDGYYSIQKASTGWSNNTLTDHTTGTGNYMIINASFQADEFYRKRLVNLEVGQQYVMSFYVANLSPDAALLPNITAAVADTSGTILSSVSTGNVSSSSWTKYTFTFTAQSTTEDVYLKNNANGGGGNDLALDDISISPLTGTIDNIVIDGNPVFLCKGTSYNLSNTTPGGVWSTSNSGIASINSSTGVLTATGAGNATITYAVTSTVGCTATTTTAIQVVASPVVGVSSSKNAFCIGGSVNLSSTVSSGKTPYVYLWSASPAATAGLGATNGLTTSATPTSAASYVFSMKATDANGCATTASQTVVVDAFPSATISYAGNPLCATGTGNVTLTGTTGGTYTSTPAGLSISASTGAINSAASTTGTYTVTYTFANGTCSNSTTTGVTINPLPTVAAITAPATFVCVGSTLQLSDATIGGSWSSSSNSLATVDGNGVVTGVSAGTVTITYTYNNGTCSRSVTTSITVRALPTVAAITGTTSFCEGSTTQLSNTTSGGVWSSNDETIATVSSSGKVAGVSAGTATIYYTVDNGFCSKTVAAAVTVKALPVLSSIIGDIDLCANINSTLSCTPSGGTWSSNNTTVATITSGGVVSTKNKNGTALITYTYTSAGCSSSATTTVTVNIAPTVSSISGSSSVCAGNTLQLADNTNNGVWSSSNEAIATVDNNGLVTSMAGTSGSVTISYTVTNGVCDKSVTKNITVNQTPSAGVISGDATLCAGATSTLSSTVTGGTWSIGSTNVATVNSSSGVVTAKATGTSVITYTVVIGSCSAKATIALVVGTPVSVSGITPSGTSAICADGTFQLSNATSGGFWSSSDESRATVNATGLVAGVSNGAVTISYTVNSANGGCSNSVTKAMTINALPAVAPITGGASVCVDNTLQLTDATAGGTWSTSDAGVATVSSTGLVTGITEGTVTISYSYNNGTCTKIVTASVSVMALPTVLPITGGATVCVNNSLQLGNATAGGTWSSSDVTRATVSGSGLVTGKNAGPVVIKYSYDDGSCVNSVTVPVTINSLPVVAPITGPGSVCVGNTITLSDATAGGGWSSSDASVATVTGGVVKGLKSGDVKITYIYSNGTCSDSVGVNVHVNALPAVAPITGAGPICVGNMVTLTDATAGGSWSSSDASVATVTGGVVKGLKSGDVKITYIYSNGTCSDSVGVNVHVNALPAVAPITGAGPICVGNTVTLSDATVGGSWSSSDASVATVTGGVVKGLKSGDVKITYIYSNGTCSDSVGVNVHVNGLPSVAPITGAGPICVGNTITLSDATVGGSWSSSDASVATVTGGVVKGLKSGDVKITYIYSNGTCSDSVGVNVHVNALPAVAPITGAGPICVGNRVTLSDATVGGSWSSSDASVATVTGGVVKGLKSGDVKITYIYSNGTCSDSVGVNVHVNALPAVAPITGAGSICMGNTVTLSDATVGGSWSSSDASVATVTGGVVKGLKSGDTKITYIYSNGTCSDSVGVNVHVNALPAVAPITGASPSGVCVGNTITLSDATAGGSWSSSDASVATVTGGVVKGLKSGDVKITYIYSNGTCSDSVGVNVHVNALPAVAPITGAGSICVGNTVTLSDATAGGSWSSSDASVATVTGGVVKGLKSGDVKITYIYSNGTCSDSVGVNVHVNALPTVAPITGTSPSGVCVGNTITLSDATAGGSWSSSDASVATVTGGVVKGLKSGDVKITYIYSNGTCSDSVGVNVHVNALPAVAPITGAGSICVGNTVTLSDATAGGSWSSSDASVATVTGGVVKGLKSGDVKITYIYNDGTCSDSVGVNVHVNALPAVAPITGAGPICVGNSVTLSDATVGGSWSSSDASVATVTGSVVKGLKSGDVKITYIYSNGICSDSVGVNVHVNALPTVAPITGVTPGGVCVGNTVTLSDATAGGSWSSSDASVATVTGGVVKGLKSGDVKITYIYSNGTCSDSVGVNVHVNGLPTMALITGAGSICLGNTITLSDATVGGSWSSSDASVATVTGGVVKGLKSGDVKITYIYSNGTCSDSVGVNVHVNGLPSVAPITGVTPGGVCVGNTITLSDATAGGSWSSSDASVATVTGGVVKGLKSGDVKITYIYSNGTCSDSVGVSVHVNGLPTVAPITGAGPVCVGNTITLSDATAGGSWSSSDASVATVTGRVIKGVKPGDVKITYIYSNGICSDSVGVNVHVNGLPSVAPITGAGPVCVGNTITLSDATTGGNWSSSDASVATVTGGVVKGLKSGDVKITYIYSNGTCSDSVGVNVHVNALPTVAPIIGAGSVCVGNTVTLTDATAGGSWSSNDASVATVTGGVVKGLKSGDVKITYIYSNGTCSDSVGVNEHVNGLPTVAPITGAGPICVGNTITLSDATAGGSWSSSDASVATVTGGVVKGLKSGDVKITYLYSNGTCSDSVGASVHVNGLPAVAPIAGPGSVCVGNTITLTDATAGGSWSSSDASVATVAGGVVTGIASGDVKITYIYSNGTCSDSVGASVHVNGLSTVAPIAGPGAVCVGNTITLTDATAGGSWSSSDASVATVTGGVVTGIASGDVKITYTYSNGTCSDSVGVNVHINGLPTVTSIAGPGTVCVGNTITLTDATAGGSWSSSDASVATVTGGVVKGLKSGDVKISYIYSNGTCSDSAGVNVHINALPAVAPITGVTPGGVCVGNTITLTDAITGGSWSSSDESVAVVKGGIVTGIASGNVKIIYVYSNGTCSDSVGASVHVNSLPTIAPIAGLGAVCVGNIITLTDATAGGYWSSSDKNVATVAGGVVTGIASGDVKITYIYNNGTCSDSVGTSVHVNGLPTVAAIAGPGAVCIGNTITLTDATTGGSWSSSNETVAVVKGGVVTGIATGDVKITYTYSNGTCSDSVGASVYVNGLPTVASIAGPGAVCVGNTITLTDATAGGSWSSSDASVAVVKGGVVTGIASGDVKITYIYSNGTCSDSVRASVHVNGLPTVAPIAGPSAVCVGNTITLTDAIAGGSWSSSDASVAVVKGGVVTGTASGDVKITYTYSNGTCSDSVGASVHVNSLPTVASIAGPGAVCVGNAISLTDATAGGSWSSSNATVATVAGGVVTGIASGDVKITYVYSNGICSDSVGASVHVNGLPTVASIAGPGAVCVGNTITLTDATAGGSWSSSDETIAVVTGGIVTGIASGDVKITYVYSNGTCSDSAGVNVHINALPAVAPITGVTPGGVCVGNTVTLTDATAGGSWSSSDASVATVTGGVAKGLKSGDVKITYIYSNGTCSDSVGASIHVNGLPSVAPITGAVPGGVCVGNAVTLSDATVGGSWSSSDASVATVTGGVVTGIASGDVKITYVYSNGTCSDSVGASVHVNGLPTVAPIAGPGTVCGGNTITLTDATAGGSWSSSDASVATVAGGVVTGIASGDVKITYIYSNGTCGDSVGASVHVNGLPSVAPIAGPGAVCMGNTIMLTDATAGGSWSSSDETIAVVKGGIVTGIASGNVKITYIYSNGTCSDSVGASVHVNGLPTVAPIAGPGSVCVGNAITLTDATAGGSWSSSDASVATVTGGVVTGIASGDVKITYLYSNGNCSDSVGGSVHVNSLPTVASIAGPGTVCVGNTITLTDATAGGSWSSSDETIAVVKGGVVTGIASGDVKITYIYSNGTCSDSVGVNVHVNGLPSVAPITGAVPGGVCVGNAVILSDATVGGSWSSSDASVATVAGGVVTGIASGDVKITYVYSNGTCSDSVDASVHVNGLPTVAPITGAGPVCVGNTVTLTDATVGGSWSSSDASVATVTGGVVKGLKSGDVKITYIYSNGTCSDSVGVNVHVNGLPTVASIAGPGSVCVGNSITLTDAVAGGNWSSSDVSVATVTGGVVTGIASGDVKITYVYSNGTCSDSIGANVHVNGLPTVVAIAGPGSVCVGNAITLTDATLGGSWSSSDASVATVAGGVVTGIASGDVKISYIYSNGTCSDFVGASVHVNGLPTVASIAGSGAVCIGNTITLTDATAGGSWSSSDASVATVTGGVVTGIASGDVKITYIYSNGNCSDSVGASVHVNDLPTVAPIAGPGAVCVGNTITLTDATAGGSWSSSDVSVATVAGGVVTGIVSGDVKITYIYSNGTCSDSVRASVHVNGLPTVVAIAGPGAVCVGNTITLTDATAGGSWSSSDASVATVTGGVVTGIASGDVKITYIYSNGTCSDSVGANVHVNGLPSVAPIAGLSAVCVGNTITLTNATAGGSWSSSNETVAVVNDGVVTGIATGDVKITYIYSNGTCSDSVGASVHVNGLPAVAPIAGSGAVCVGNTITLTDATAGGSWSSSDASVATVIGGVVTGIASGDVKITYVYSNGTCSDSVGASVHVNGLPAVAPIAGPVAVCVGNAITLTDAIAGGSWSSSDASVATVTSGVVTGIASGDVKITYIYSNGTCSDSVGVSVYVNGLPSVAPIAGPGAVCMGNTIMLTDATAGGSWSSSDASVATVTGGVVTGIASGDVKITYIYSNGTCSDSVGAGVHVNGLPTVASIAGSGSVCVGNTITLTNATVGGSWSSSDESVAVVKGGVVTGIASGDVKITYVYSNGTCSDSVGASVHVNGLPTVAPIAGPGTVCVGNTITLIDATAGGSWSSSDGSVATVAGGVVTGIASGDVKITYIYSNGTCSDSVGASVHVNGLPTVAPIAGPGSVCVGNTIRLRDATAGGSWSSSDVSVATVTGGVVTGIASGDVKITYLYSNGNCSDSVGGSVHVNSLPTVASIAGPGAVCVGNTITLTNATAGGNWSSSDASVATVTGGVVTGIASGDVKITYIYSNGTCSDSVGASVHVNGLPAVAPIAGPGSVCVGNTITLTDATTGGSWSSSDETVAVVKGGVVTGIVSGDVKVTYIYSNGACSDSVGANVHVNGLPSVAPIAGPGTVCVGNAITLTDATAGGSWSSSDASVGVVNGGVVTGIASGDVKITYIYNNGTCSDSVGASIHVNGLPAVTAIGGPGSVCVGNAITLTDATAGGSWSSSDASVATVAGGVVTGIAPGDVKITYIYSNGTCSDSAGASVHVNGLPAVTVIGGPGSVCVGNAITLTDATAGGSWSSSDASVATVTGGVVTGIAPGDVKITYIYSNGTCSDSVGAIVHVNGLPAVAPIAGPGSVCVGNTITLTDATAGGSWSSSDGSVATVAGGVVTGIASGDVKITYIYSNSTCSDSVGASVHVNGLPTVAPIAGPGSVCVGNTITLTDATAGGSWSSSDASVATVIGGVVTGIASGDVKITYIYSNGTCSDSVGASVHVNGLPTVASIAGSGSVCVGNTITLTNATVGGSWSSSDESVAVVKGGIVTGIASGNVKITYTYSNGTCSDSVGASVNVNGLPTVTPIAGPGTVCVGNAITLTDATAGGNWSSSDENVATVIGGVVTGISSGDVKITYIYSNGNCSDSVGASVHVNGLPTVAPIAGPGAVCVGNAITLTDATVGGSWSSGDASVAVVKGGVVTGIATGDVKITYIYSNGTCSDSVGANVHVNGLPSVAPIAGPGTVCVGNAITLTDATAGGSWNSSDASVATVTGGVVTGIASGDVKITYIYNNGTCSDSVGASVHVNGLPTVAPIAGPGAVCVGNTITLTDATAGGSWSSSDASVAVVNGGVVTGIATGDVKITYIYSNGTCSDSVGASVHVNGLPTVAAIAGSGLVCVGNTITLTNATVGGSWSSSDESVAVVKGGIVTGIASGDVKITYIYSNGTCSDSVGASVHVNGLPTVAPIAGPGAVCVGNAITLTDATAGGSWSSSDASVAVVKGGVVTGIASGDVKITYIYSNGTCSDSVGASVHVNGLPSVAPIAGPGTVCVGNAITLIDATAGGSWSSSDGSVATVAGGVVTGIASGDVKITYIYNNGTCSDSVGASVHVNGLPIMVPIAGPGAVCVGNTITLTDATAGGSWSSSDASVATVTGGVVTGIASGDVKITYIYNNGTCSDSVGASVHVNGLPAVTAIGGPGSVCVGNTITLTDATAGGSWSSSDASVATVIGGVVTGIASGDVKITYIYSNGTCSDSVGASVHVNGLPTVAAIAGSGSVCVGNTITLTNATVGGSWSSSDETIAVVKGGIVTSIASGDVKITYIYSNGTCSDSVGASVHVNSLPTVASIAGPGAVCVGNTITLTNATAGGSWSSSDASVATVIGGVVTGIASGDVKITYIYNNGTCSDSVGASVHVNGLPTVASIAGSGSVCVGNTITLTNATVGGSWSSSDESVAVVKGGIVTGIASGDVKITYIYSNGTCSDSVGASVHVNGLPTVAPIAGPGAVCVGNTITLIDATAGGSWSSSDGSVATVAGGVVTGIASGDVKITYIYSNGNCSDSVGASVHVNGLPTVASIAGSGSVCVGNTITLTNATVGGSWSSSDASVAVVKGGVVTGIASGDVKITYIYSNGTCNDSIGASVHVNGLPTVASIAGPGSVCVGNTIILTDATASGSWSSSDASVAVVNGGVVTGITSGDVKITYIYNNGTCSDSVGASVHVNGLPTVSPIAGLGAVCVGNTITLTDATAGGGWSSSDENIAAVKGGVVTGITSGDVKITYIYSNGTCSDSVGASVHVNGLPTVAPIAGPGAVCVGNTITLIDATAGGSWSSSDGSVATVAGGVVTGIASGDVKITYIYSNGTCNDSIGASVHVNGLPTVASIAGPGSVCVGNAITLTDATVGGSWSSSDASVAVVKGGVVTGIASGDVKITYIYSNGTCSDSVGANVHVNGLPTVAPIAGSGAVCVGNTITLTDATVGGSWSSSDTSVATVTGGVVTGIASGDVKITYIYSNGTCSDSVGTSVHVNGLPTVASIAGPGTVCVGNTITLTDATAGGGWSSSDASVATVAGGVVTGIASGDVKITYIYSNGTCSDSVGTSVHVNGLPTVAPIAGPGAVCVGNTITLADATAGGSWSSSDATIAAVKGGIVTGIASGDVKITYIYSNGTCSDSVKTNVRVNSLPIVPPITGGKSVCVGNSITLSNAMSAGSWSSKDTSIASVAASGQVKAKMAGVAEIVYTVTDVNGCVADTHIDVSIAPLPDFTLTGTALSCNAGADGKITVNTADEDLIYSLNNGGFQTSKVFVGLAAGEYTVTARNTSGCNMSQTVTLTEPKAIALSEYSVNISCHASATGSIDMSVSGGKAPYTYLWNTGDTTEDAIGLSAGVYTVEVKDAMGCLAKMTTTLNEIISVFTLKRPVAKDDATVQISGTTIANANVLVTYTDGSSAVTRASGSGAFTATSVKKMPSGTIVVLVKDPVTGVTCSKSVQYLSTASSDLTLTKKLIATDNIQVGSYATFVITVSAKGPDNASGVVITDPLSSLLDGVDSVKTTRGTVSYNSVTKIMEWTVDTLKPGATEQLSFRVRVVAAGKLENTATASLNEIDPVLADNTASSEPVVVTKTFMIPNVVTPNGNGKNDRFVIPGVPSSVSMDLLIVNRWGSEVYHSRNYDNRWDGTGLSAGVYYYVLKMDAGGKEHVYKGFIQLMK